MPRTCTLLDGLLEIEDRAVRIRIGRKVEQLLLHSLDREWSFEVAVEVALLRAFLEVVERPLPSHPPELLA